MSALSHQHEDGSDLAGVSGLCSESGKVRTTPLRCLLGKVKSRIVTKYFSKCPWMIGFSVVSMGFPLQGPVKSLALCAESTSSRRAAGWVPAGAPSGCLLSALCPVFPSRTALPQFERQSQREALQLHGREPVTHSLINALNFVPSKKRLGCANFRLIK